MFARVLPPLVAALVLLVAPSARAGVPDAVVEALRDDPVYVHPDVDSALTQSEVRELRKRIEESATGPIRVAVLPPAAVQEAGGSAEAAIVQIAGRVRKLGVYAVVVPGTGSDAFRAASNGVVRGEEARVAAARAAQANGDAVGPLLIDFVTDIGASDSGDTAAASPARQSSQTRDGGGGIGAGALVLLAIGALLGGALVVGGEWKAGTVLTVATWEVRRPRLLGARLLACGILAPTIAIGLLGLFVAGTLPVVLTKGSTAGIDGAWLAGFAGTVGRGLLVVTFAAVLGAAIASIARGATAAFVVLFALNAVIEPAIRGWFPGVSGWLLGENLAALVGGEVLDGDGFRRGPGVAGVLLAVYVTAVLVAATAIFDRRDLGSAA